MGEPEWQGLCGKIHGSVCGSWQCSRKADHDGSCSPERPAEEGPKWPAMTPSPAGGGEDVDAVESLNEAHPDYGLTQRLIEAVEQGTRTDEIREQAAILAELARLRTALAAAERAGAERALRWAAANRRARQEDNETFRTRGISALFPVRPIPPPGAEVGRG